MVSCGTIKTAFIVSGSCRYRDTLQADAWEPRKVQQGDTYANEGILIRLDCRPGPDAARRVVVLRLKGAQDGPVRAKEVDDDKTEQR